MGKSSGPNLTGKCLICGNNVKIKVISRNEYFDTCGGSCGSKLGQKRLLEKTSIHPSQTPEVQEKRKNTCIQKYGHSTPLHRSHVIEKRNLSLAKTSTTDKIKTTLLTRYGVTSPLKSPKIRDKQIRTQLERFGVLSMRNELIKSKNKQSNLTSYIGNAFLEKLNAIEDNLDIFPLFNVQEYSGTNKEYKWIHRFCRTEFKQILHVNGAPPRCPKCNPPNISIPQSLVIQVLTELKIKFIVNDRKTLSPLELDILIPDKNIAIEINGVYWHQAGQRTSLLQKTKLCESKGIILLHFWDTEVLTKLSIIKDIISSKLGIIHHIIGARKCHMEEISKSKARAFLESYHLDGSTSASSLHLALSNHEDIIAVATFSKSRFKKGEIELLRFCVTPGISCPGAISRFIKHAKNILNVNSIITYANRRYSSGKGYGKIGINISTTLPNYFYVVGFGKDIKIIPRMAAQKHKLKNLMVRFDPNISESKNAKLNGWLKVCDSGNFKFLL